MKLAKITYHSLNSKAKETYNFQKLSAILVDYGFSTNWLNVDFESADFIAVHFNGIDILKVQLKSRITVDRKYIDKDIYMAWPHEKSFFLIPHESLLKIIEETTTWLTTDSWLQKGKYSSDKPNSKTIEALENYLI